MPTRALTLSRRLGSTAVALAALATSAPAARAVGLFDIVINAGPTLQANPAALAAFERSALEWESRISDPITININADLGTFGNPNIIGSASSVGLQGGFDLIRNQLVADSAGKPGKEIIAFLPTAATLSLALPAGATYTGNLAGNKATLKAMGFGGLDAIAGTTNDGTITFNSAFAFDFDRSNGVGGGLTDFQTVATHEIGHVLGFVSAVDNFDGGLTSSNINVLDLYRFTLGAQPSTAAMFTTATRDLRPNSASVTGDTVNNFGMSTGVNLGDGRQASHWKDNDLTGSLIGVMDPTLGAGQTFLISEADFRAMELIGFDVVVPEPGSLTLGALGLGGLGLLAARRRRRSR